MSIEAGSVVKGYNHLYGSFPDGTEGTYLGFGIDSRDAHAVKIKEYGIANFERVESVDNLSELERYKQDVLLPALERKNEQHNWCGEYDEFLKEINLTRTLVELPTGKNALIESKSGFIYRRVNNDAWVSNSSVYHSDRDIRNVYKRTIFEGE